MDVREPLRCKRCGEVIGVYEPMVVYAKGLARTTSRAAEPDLEAVAAAHYHRDCYATEAEKRVSWKPLLRGGGSAEIGSYRSSLS